MKMLSLLVVLSLCGAITASPTSLVTDSSLGIAGGKVVKITDHPYEVSIERDDGTYCAGSIISIDRVLTTALCASSVKKGQGVIRHGSDNRGFRGETKEISKTFLHDDYNPANLKNNIGIIRIEGTFPSNEFTQTIDLSDSAGDRKSGIVATVSGWGKTNANTPTNDLNEITVKIMDDKECREKVNAPWDNEFCAGDLGKGKGACWGDSGAPLVTKVGDKPKLIGLQSYVFSNCNGESPDVYVDVFAQKEWINKPKN